MEGRNAGPLPSAAAGIASGGRGRVLVVAGTHGNERNAPWLLEAWSRQPDLVACHGLALRRVVGNPAAFVANCRYLDRDLNRSFQPALLADAANTEREVARARELVQRHGPSGEDPCLVAVDLHSTTAAMGNSLVVYGRRPADLALAASLQGRLGLPIYLHEGDPRQTGYLAECWPCGLVIEVGPVPQGVLTALVVEQTRLALESGLAQLAAARRGELRLPAELVVHRHLGSEDLPRCADGSPAALIHPLRQHRDWQPLVDGDPLFLTADGSTIPYRPAAALKGMTVWPVFVNEAAYGEKGIALSYTARERWPVQRAWGEALRELAAELSLEAAAG